jgi:CheY-like chemotaxis protein
LQVGKDHRVAGLPVLIVEDELIIAMELEYLLKSLGCTVLDPASRIRQALRALADEPPDIAVLDLNLLGERVTPVAEALQEKGIPFVLVTGYGGERLHEAALKHAPRLRKPVDARQLLNAMAEVLARVRSKG